MAPDMPTDRRCLTGDVAPGKPATTISDASKECEDVVDDEDDFLVPVYPVKAADRTEVEPATRRGSPAVFLTAVGDGLVVAPTVRPNGIKLSDYFPSLGTIFPVTCNANGPK